MPEKTNPRDLTDRERAWIDAVVADAPALTTDQITDLRRILHPEQWLAALEPA